MPIPTLWAVQANVYFIGCSDEFIGQARSATRAEDDPGLLEGVIYLFIPPAGVAKFNDVASRRIKLGDDVVKSGLRVAVARGELEQKTAHAVAENIGDHSKILDESFGAREPLHMRDELTDFDGVNEFFLAGLAAPGLNVGNRRPRVKGCVDFDGVEALQVVLEPILLRTRPIIRRRAAAFLGAWASLSLLK